MLWAEDSDSEELYEQQAAAERQAAAALRVLQKNNLMNWLKSPSNDELLVDIVNEYGTKCLNTAAEILKNNPFIQQSGMINSLSNADIMEVLENRLNFIGIANRPFAKVMGLWWHRMGK